MLSLYYLFLGLMIVMTAADIAVHLHTRVTRTMITTVCSAASQGDGLVFVSCIHNSVLYVWFCHTERLLYTS